jgi:hypothetical protein
MVVFCGRVRARERGVMIVREFVRVATAECYATCERRLRTPPSFVLRGALAACEWVLALTVSCGSLVSIVVVGLHPGLGA